MTNPLFDTLFAPLAAREGAFLHTADGSQITGPDFLATIARLAHVLRDIGVAPGDRVAVQVPKTPEALALYGASVAVGAVFLPLNTSYTEAEIDYFISDARPALFVCDPKSEASLAPVTARHGAALLTLGADGRGSLTDRATAAAAEFTPTDRASDDLAAILYTSGTTGRSKGAMLTQDNLLSNASALAAEWRFTGGDVLLHALPIFHTHGLFVATHVCLASGASMIFLPGFDADEVFRLLPQATTLMGVPTFYTRLLDDPRLTREATAHMRLFVSGSAPLLAETHAGFAARTGHAILERYGMTETNMNTSNPYDGARRPGTVGRPLPGVEVIVTDPTTGAALPQGEIGMIEVRGPNVFKGYWQMPEKTREELRETGFFITGDLGRFDDDGYLSIVGRQKDLIITGGYNVYPKEVELILDDQPGVLESAVIGVPHPDFGEAVLAVLVPTKDATPDLAAIDTALRATLARFKQPKALELVDSLPRNKMGKVQKAELRARFADRFAPPGKRAAEG
ncbi:malonate--CoA ligase [Roseicyclus marinus]|uniref:malonate--CoA ligase n=1 Tax=Roseicyclus marinus TaxID=2161673 RepID=UPI0024103E24|nr:malonyl-CoA synthase [Roseicyclus marinus]MDG3041606.1 malonyl-CoA synthase [Roseicyclus marinus]